MFPFIVRVIGKKLGARRNNTRKKLGLN